MRWLVGLALFGIGVSVSAAAQQDCVAGALPAAARQVVAVRHQLHAVAVKENDPAVPAAVAGQLQRLKTALAAAADAALACAPPDVDPADLQDDLARALHANLSTAAETATLTRDGRDLGAYGSDLAVQLIPLYNSPRYLEVNFRYGVECGDDNLLLVYEAGGARGPGWHPVLRWGAAGYTTVGDAVGDFVLLTPLSGYPGDRNWRFVVAYGEPACTGPSAPSRFRLQLLEPSADPAQPRVVWQMEHADRRDQVPRLSTTEDTLRFELRNPASTAKGAPGAKDPSTGTGDLYRFHVSKDNVVSPLDGSSPGAEAAPADAGAASRP